MMIITLKANKSLLLQPEREEETDKCGKSCMFGFQ